MTYDDQTDGRRGRARQGIYIERDARTTGATMILYTISFGRSAGLAWPENPGELVRNAAPVNLHLTMHVISWSEPGRRPRVAERRRPVRPARCASVPPRGRLA